MTTRTWTGTASPPADYLALKRRCEESEARAERAEADSAAWLKRVQTVIAYAANEDPEDAMERVLSELRAGVAEDHPGAALLAEVEALRKVAAALRAVDWERADWQGFCPFRKNSGLRCPGSDGVRSGMGTPKPVPHSDGCPYHALAAVDALKERGT